MVRTLIRCGIQVEMQHHEVGTAGQAEIDIRFAPLLQMADNLMLYKYVVKNVARAAGKTVTFMPKPLFGDNGSACTVTRACGRTAPLFYDEVGYAGLSDDRPLLHRRPAEARAFAAGLHQPDSELLPSPGARLRGAGEPGLLAAQPFGVRAHPDHWRQPQGQAAGVPVPDPSANPYLAFAAMMMAGIDGIQNKIEPPEPVDKDLYELPPDEALAIPQVPGSLEKVLDTLEADHEYLLDGGVFTADLVETWIDYKRSNELDPLRLRPHPHEFELYFDV